MRSKQSRQARRPKQPVVPASATVLRLNSIDLLRGCAVAMMVAYHFCYDLAHFGLARWTTDDMLLNAGWIIWRNGIVTSFLTLVGVSLALRTAFKPGWKDFWKRWVQIAGAALLVSIASIFFAGERWIYFGILHFIAVALLLGRLCLQAGLGRFALAAIGLTLLAVGLLYSNPIFNAAPLNIIGLITQKPQTEDYVPLLPWLGVVLLGTALGRFLMERDRLKIPDLESKMMLQPFLLMGRWSLLIYLVHQPVLMGLLAGITALKI